VAAAPAFAADDLARMVRGPHFLGLVDPAQVTTRVRPDLLGVARRQLASETSAMFVAAEPQPKPNSPGVEIPWHEMASELIRMMTLFWWLWILIGLLAVGKLAYRIYETRRIARSGIREVDVMDGQTFERYLATLFQRLGYEVERTGRRGDYGADLVVWRDGVKIAVQAKRWTKNIGVRAIQEAVASKGYYKADRSMVVANRPFTQQARVLARANEVELWDRDRLMEEMLSHPVGDSVTGAPMKGAAF
jgi:restriction system protein